MVVRLYKLIVTFYMEIKFIGTYFSFSEAQEQVTANLANFAYDPINWQYLKDAAAVELFLELLSSRNPRLILHGTAALCNIVPGM